MKLPIDFSHPPADMDEAKEMLRRAERELSDLRAKLAEANGVVQHNHDIAGEWHAKYSAAMKRVSELEAKLAAAEKAADEMDIFVDRFLAWPVPYSVCCDPCATKQGPGRSGTSLLTANEARAMLEFVLNGR